MGSSRRIEKCPQSGWGCMGGGATDHDLEDHLNPVQLYTQSSFYAYGTVSLGELINISEKNTKL